MAITIPSFSVSSVITSSANTTIVGTYPAGAQSGDLLVALLASYDQLSNSSLSAAGWTVRAENYTTESGTVSAHIAVLTAPYTGSNNLTFTIGADTRDDQLYILRVAGDYDATTPISSVQAIATANTTAPISPSATSTTPNSLLLSFVAAKVGSSAAADDTGEPTGMTIIANRRSRALSVAVRSAAAYKLLTSPAASGAQTWTAFTSANQYNSTTSFIINHAAATQTIDSTNSGADDLNSGTVNTASVTGYVVGVNPVVSGTVGSLALTSVSQSEGVVSATIPAPVNDSYWPEPDVSHLLTFTDGSNPATFNAVMNSLAGYTSIVAVSPDLADTHKIPYWLTSTAVNDDRIMYKTADMTVAADGGISGATLGATTIYYHWRVADSKIFAYEALLDEDGIATSTSKSYFIGLGIGIGF